MSGYLISGPELLSAIHESALRNVVDICNITDLKMLGVEGGNFVDLCIEVETILI